MARHEGHFEAAGESPEEVEDVLAALRREAIAVKGPRHRAMACFLSAGDGWQAAGARLGGSFAEFGRGPWLTESKD